MHGRIAEEFLGLIQDELVVDYRNRENLILLSRADRDDLQKFMSEVAMLNAYTRNRLQSFYQFHQEENAHNASGNAAAASIAQRNGFMALGEAGKKVDSLVALSLEVCRTLLGNFEARLSARNRTVIETKVRKIGTHAALFARSCSATIRCRPALEGEAFHPLMDAAVRAAVNLARLDWRQDPGHERCR